MRTVKELTENPRHPKEQHGEPFLPLGLHPGKTSFKAHEGMFYSVTDQRVQVSYSVASGRRQIPQRWETRWLPSQDTLGSPPSPCPSPGWHFERSNLYINEFISICHFPSGGLVA